MAVAYDDTVIKSNPAFSIICEIKNDVCFPWNAATIINLKEKTKLYGTIPESHQDNRKNVLWTLNAKAKYFYFLDYRSRMEADSPVLNQKLKIINDRGRLGK